MTSEVMMIWRKMWKQQQSDLQNYQLPSKKGEATCWDSGLEEAYLWLLQDQRRKCGYSKKFLEEHRQEILLHKAAKNAFDELHLKKFPKIKDLSAEYAEILAEKKKLYGEYRQVKKDMQEIQRAKYDIDQFLKSDEEQKKERVRKHNITR